MFPLNHSIDILKHPSKATTSPKKTSKSLQRSVKALSWNQNEGKTPKMVSHRRHSDLRTLKIGTIQMIFTLEQGHLVYGFSG